MSVDPQAQGDPCAVPRRARSSDTWEVVGVSTRGTSHAKTGQPCQDAHYARSVAPGVLVAAVADGAGSAAFSERGANAAAHSAVDELADDPSLNQWLDSTYDWEPRLRHALQAAREAVQWTAESIGQPTRELASTLILFVATPTRVMAAQIGDGAVVVGDRDGGIFSVTNPTADEYVNRTHFLTGTAAVEQAQLALWRGAVDHIAAFSDGLQRLALQMPDAMPHKPFFLPLFRFVDEAADPVAAREQLEQFLRSPRIAQRADDDLTLLLARPTR